MYPNAQILPLDYDPDVSFMNIENRLQMLVMNAETRNLGRKMKNETVEEVITTWKVTKTYRRKKYGVEKLLVYKI